MRLRFSMYTSDEMGYILSLNLKRIVSSLKDYIDCRPTANWYSRGRVMDDTLASSHKWGIDCYDTVKNKIENREINFLLQSCYVINNHKVVMIERIKKIDHFYIFIQKDIHIQNYQVLREMTRTLLNMVIKFQFLLESEDLVKKICDLLTEIKLLDYQYTLLLIHDLQNILNNNLIQD